MTAKKKYPFDLGVTSIAQKVFLFFNLFGYEKDPFRVSVSTDGLDFKRYQKDPSIIDKKGEKENTLKCKDFRISKTDKGYLLIYKYQSGESAYLMEALSKDLVSWEKLGRISNLKERAMVVPEYKYNDQYVMFTGEDEIKIAFSKDLRKWDIKETIVSPRDNFFDKFPVEIGSAILIDKGILLTYFVRFSRREGNHYFVGAALLDKTDPSRVIWRKNLPLWEQGSEWDERHVYPVGVIEFKGKYILYLGTEGEGVFAVCFKSLDDIFKEELEKQALALEKHDGNPIIRPVLKHYWESQATFNSAAIYEGGRVHFIYRAIGDSNISVLGYASSSDGLNIDERHHEPIYTPSEPFEFPGNIPPSFTSPFMSGGGYGGCEDPRITRVEDKLYLTYVAYNGTDHPRVALSSIKVEDFLNKKWNWEKPKLISPPGVVNKNACIFPEKINGKYVILHRVFPNILIDLVDSLDFEDTFLEGHYSITPRDDFWDSRKIGAGPPPIKTDEGWLLIYHAVDNRDASRYKIGAMLLDLNDPTKVLYRTNSPIIEPIESYENEGYKSGVAYPCGAVVKHNKLFIYYGGADTVLCAAHKNLDRFLSELKRFGSPKLNSRYTPRRVSRYYV